jgi:hypothetical protein
MQQRADDVFLVAASAQCARRSQQRVHISIHREAAEVAGQELKVRDDTFRQAHREAGELPADDTPVFAGTLIQSREARLWSAFVHTMSPS